MQNYQKAKKDTIWYLLQKIGIFFQEESHMKLNEQHKEFAVKCFARFMTRTEVVKAFLKEFENDLPPQMKHINLAHQILKTLVACNAINTEQDIVNITPQNPKALEEKK